MKRAAMTAMLVDDPKAIEEYERYHADVWPEVVADNERCGARRIYIFRSGRRLFMFIEGTDDFDIDSFGDCIGQGHQRTQEWLRMMEGFMVEAEGGTDGMQWSVLDEICALEASNWP